MFNCVSLVFFVKTEAMCGEYRAIHAACWYMHICVIVWICSCIHANVST